MKISHRSVQGLLNNSAALLTTPRRFLDLHEYQSKDLAQRYGVRVQQGYMAESPEETQAHAETLLAQGAPELVLKAQIHAGGRGKGHFNTGFKGGVQFSTDPAELANYSREMFGNNLITKQTPPEGQTVKKVLVHESLNFSETQPEFYLAFLMDRAYGGPVMVASREGGMDIEEVAERSPDAILKDAIDIHTGLTTEQARSMASNLGLEGELVDDAADQMKNLYSMFLDLDCTQIEINPLVINDKNKGMPACL
jgi:succinyl-CoA synthetase beta subunit